MLSTEIGCYRLSKQFELLELTSASISPVIIPNFPVISCHNWRVALLPTYSLVSLILSYSFGYSNLALSPIYLVLTLFLSLQIYFLHNLNIFVWFQWSTFVPNKWVVNVENFGLWNTVPDKSHLLSNCSCEK